MDFASRGYHCAGESHPMLGWCMRRIRFLVPGYSRPGALIEAVGPVIDGLCLCGTWRWCWLKRAVAGGTVGTYGTYGRYGKYGSLNLNTVPIFKVRSKSMIFQWFSHFVPKYLIFLTFRHRRVAGCNERSMAYFRSVLFQTFPAAFDMSSFTFSFCFVERIFKMLF
jgi:hypothetical protein